MVATSFLLAAWVGVKLSGGIVDEDGLWLEGLGASPIGRGGGAGSGAITGGNV